MTGLMHCDWIGKWAERLPGKVAISEAESGRTATYAELHAASCHLSHFLQNELGLEAGSRIALLSENCIENIMLFSVAQKTGSCLVPLNYRLSPGEINHLLLDSAPRLLIYDKKYNKLIDGVDFVKNKIELLTWEDLKKVVEQTDPEKAYPFRQAIAKEDDPIFILYTSGSTGIPKGAVYSHKMMFWNSINTSLTISLNTEIRTIMGMPPFHTGGWNVLTTPLLHFGGHSCLVKKFDPGLILKKIEEVKPQLIMAVPTMLKLLTEHELFKSSDLSSLAYLIVGGEPLPVPLIELWHSRGVKIRQGYGMTEVGPNLTSLHHDYAMSKKGSIGKTNFYLDYRIVDGMNRDVEKGQTGELLFKGPVVTPGYWNNKKATRESLVDGWFYSGDLAREDEDGFLYIVDRIKNMYISGGENVYPAEVERVILKLDSVSECAVVSQPDPKWGETGVVFIVSNTVGEKGEKGANQILNHCKKYLAGFKIPRKIIFKKSLPKTDSGKIDRKVLKKLVDNPQG